MTLLLHNLQRCTGQWAGIGIKAGVTLALLFLANRAWASPRVLRMSAASSCRRPTSSARHHIGSPLAMPLLPDSSSADSCRPFYRRRWEADLVARDLDQAVGFGPAGQARLDVRWRPLHRIRHTAGRWMQERSTQSSGSPTWSCQASCHPQLHGAGIVTTQIIYRVIFPLVGAQ